MSQVTEFADLTSVAAMNKRAFVRRRAKSSAKIRLGEKPLDPAYKAIVSDISQSGIRFSVGTELQIRQRIIIEIMLSTSNTQAQRRAAEVRWVAPDREPGQFRIGCAWIERLSYAELPRPV